MNADMNNVRDICEQLVGEIDENEERSCSCHINPPCGKCCNSSINDLIEELKAALEG